MRGGGGGWVGENGGLTDGRGQRPVSSIGLPVHMGDNTIIEPLAFILSPPWYEENRIS